MRVLSLYDSSFSVSSSAIASSNAYKYARQHFHALLSGFTPAYTELTNLPHCYPKSMTKASSIFLFHHEEQWRPKWTADHYTTGGKTEVCRGSRWKPRTTLLPHQHWVLKRQVHSVTLKNDSHSLKSHLTTPLKSNTFIKNEGLISLKQAVETKVPLNWSTYCTWVSRKENGRQGLFDGGVEYFQFLFKTA